MLRTIRNFFEAKSLEIENKVAEQKALGAILREAEGLVTERPDAGGYVRIAQATDREKGHLESNQLEMVRQSRKMWRWNENARAAISTLVNYIMGMGVTITPKSKDRRVWYVWKEFWTAQRNRMALRQFEIPIRLFRDGEVFIEFFDADENGKPTGKTSVRFLDPLLIKNPAPENAARYPFDTENTKNGIETDAEDIERVIQYWVQSRKDANGFRAVPAENVVHIRIFADSDQKRGESFLQPIMRMITQHEEWLNNRILLNKMRTAIVMIKKVEGTPSQVAALKDTLANSTRTLPGEDKKVNIRGGTVLVAGPGVDYRMESPNINATDAREDGRHIKTSMAAGTNLPEYVFGDASNANYSSSMVAEAPMVKAIQYWQSFLEYYWGLIFRRVISNAVKSGFIEDQTDDKFIASLKGESVLREQEDQPSGFEANGRLEVPSEILYGCDLQWPEIIHREVKAHTESLQLARSNGWVSDPTATAALGYDYAEEVRKQNMADAEAEKSGNSLMGRRPGDGDDEKIENELKGLLNELPPEERQAILQRRGASDIVNSVSPNGGGKNANGQTR